MPIYMKYDGIDGDVTAQGHERWMEVYSFSWGVNRALGFSGGGGGGTLRFSALNTFKPTGKGSPTLMLACCQGRLLPAVQMELTRMDGQGQEQVFQKVRLENVIISSYQSSGDGGGSIPSESVSLNFTKITYGVAVGAGVEEAFWDIPGNSGGGGQ